MKKRYGGSVLISGGSSGIGLACAQAFAAQGYEVFAASRHPGTQERRYEGGGMLIPVQMDVCDENSVREAVGTVLARAKDLGIVIHCAGMGIAGAAEDTPDADARRQIETNYFGVMRVNRCILPHFRGRGAGLCLLIGSVAGLLSIPFQSHYSSSKFALEAYAEALRCESRRYGIRVSLIEPGDTQSGFTSARSMAVPEQSIYEKACRASVAKMARDERNGRPPQSVARVALRLAGRKSPPVRVVVGFEYKAFVFLPRLLPARLINWALGRIYVPRG